MEWMPVLNEWPFLMPAESNSSLLEATGANQDQERRERERERRREQQQMGAAAKQIRKFGLIPFHLHSPSQTLFLEAVFFTIRILYIVGGRFYY